MKSPLSFGFVGNPVGPSGDIKRGKSIKRLVTLTASSLVYFSLAGFVQPASAFSNSSDPVVSALKDYVQLISAGAPDSAKVAEPAADDGVLAALRDYAQGIGTGGASSAEDSSSGLNGYVRVAAAKPAKARKAAAAGPGIAEATYIGSKVCGTCHAGVDAEFARTLMGRIGRTTRKGTMECENCHGPGSLHVKAGGGRGVGGIISFRPDDQARTAEQNNAICLACHERGDRTYWNGSIHETRGLMCTNCHTIMRSVTAKFQLRKQTELEVCFQCHKDRRAQLFRTSHMPLREGKVTCTDCHNPHGSFTEALLRENSINDNCYKCHAEKRGPFLFEHTPVRENCANCHDPHGSVNENLLKISRPRLCSECHTFDHGPTIAGGPRVVQGFGRACNNCHTQVHGTNSPSGAFLLR